MAARVSDGSKAELHRARPAAYQSVDPAAGRDAARGGGTVGALANEHRRLWGRKPGLDRVSGSDAVVASPKVLRNWFAGQKGGGDRGQPHPLGVDW